MWKGSKDFDTYLSWEEPGLYCEAPKGSGVQWFFADFGPKEASSLPPILLLHGVPAYSYMWRNVVPDLVAAGRRCIVVDLPGFGNSTMTQVGEGGFNYTIEDYVSAMSSLVESLELDKTRFEIVAHGLLGGTVGALWGARNPGQVSKLILMNTPLDKKSAGEIPKSLQPLLNPFTAAIFCQNPLNVVGNPIEGAGPYALDVNDQAVYLKPTLADGNAGFIAIAVMKELKKNGAKAVEEAVRLLSKDDAPEVEILWGASDNWLGESPPSVPKVTTNVKIINGAGHFTPEDWSEKVAKALLGQQFQ